MTLQVRLRIRRKHGWQIYNVDVPERAYLLDVLEAARRQDPSLLFRHSCHHASCGSCGIRVNGRERLACITRVDEVYRPPSSLQLEPLRNFPIVADLVVNYHPFMAGLRDVELPLLCRADSASPDELPAHRFENCIECGLCVSACPVAGSDPLYAGPAALAAAWRLLQEPRQRKTGELMNAINQEHGAWRCHAAFECSEVCPASVDPGGAIFSLRARLLRDEARL